MYCHWTAEKNCLLASNIGRPMTKPIMAVVGGKMSYADVWTYGKTNYGSGWRKDVVCPCLDLASHHNYNMPNVLSSQQRQYKHWNILMHGVPSIHFWLRCISLSSRTTSNALRTSVAKLLWCSIESRITQTTVSHNHASNILRSSESAVV